VSHIVVYPLCHALVVIGALIAAIDSDVCESLDREGHVRKIGPRCPSIPYGPGAFGREMSPHLAQRRRQLGGRCIGPGSVRCPPEALGIRLAQNAILLWDVRHSPDATKGLDRAGIEIR